jgi:hypothetical protein
VLAIAVLATGCCCPPISGRYEQPLPSKAAASHEPNSRSAADGKSADSHAHHARRVHHIGHRFGWHGLSDGPETPPGQHVPLPKFHPVPVRPVFEPQYDYSPPISTGVHLAPIVTPESLGTPTPVQPVPDPE